MPAGVERAGEGGAKAREDVLVFGERDEEDAVLGDTGSVLVVRVQALG
jgi:hypothetical protein